MNFTTNTRLFYQLIFFLELSSLCLGVEKTEESFKHSREQLNSRALKFSFSSKNKTLENSKENLNISLSTGIPDIQTTHALETKALLGGRNKFTEKRYIGRWPYQLPNFKGSFHQFLEQSKGSPFKNFGPLLHRQNPKIDLKKESFQKNLSPKNTESKKDESAAKASSIQEEKTTTNNFPDEIYKIGDLRLIYQGEYVSAKHLYFGGAKLVVSFNCAGADLTFETPGTPDMRCNFGLDFFQKNKIDVIFVGNHLNHCYQVAEMNDLIKAALVECEKYEEVITYGASMGGWAALAFSKALKAQKVIAFYPPVLLENSPIYKSSWEKYNSIEKIPKASFNISTGLSESAQLFCFYGDYFEQDKRFIEVDLKQIATSIGNKNLNFFPVPWACHHTMIPFARTGTLSRAILDIKNGKLDELRELLKRDGKIWKKMEELYEKSQCCKPIVS